MMMAPSDARIVNALHDEIIHRLDAEPADLQILVAFGVLFEVLNNAQRHQPDAATRTVRQIAQFFNALH